MNDTAYKAQAKRLADYLSRVHGVKLKHASMLEAIAQVHGRADWNTLSACGSSDTPVAAPKAQLTANDLASLPLFDRLLEESLAADAETLDLYIANEELTAYARGHRMYQGTKEDYAEALARLRTYMGEALPDLSTGPIDQRTWTYPSRLLGPVPIQVIFMPMAGRPDSQVFLRWRHPKYKVRDLAELGIRNLAEWRRALSLPSGVLLVCAPTASGKTTTITASARDISRQGRSVFILDEDIRIGDVPGAIHAPCNAGPNCVVVAELRNADQAQAAFEAAARGALVIASMHASSMETALSRLSDLDVSPEKQRALVKGIMVQRLVPTICLHCNAQGCSKCHQGVAGRTAVSACVVARQGTTIHERLFGKLRDAPSLLEDGVALCRQGIVAREHLTRVFGVEVEELLDRTSK